MYTIGLYMAPKDSTQFALLPHTSNKGLDYEGISADSAANLRGAHQVAGFSGEAFGVGALEDGDQYGVYDNDSKANYSTTLQEEEEEDFHQTHKFVSTKKDYLSNFKQGKSDRYLRKQYPPPALPPGFKPFHQPITPVVKSQPAVTIQDRAAKLGITDFDRPSEPKSDVKEEEVMEMKTVEPYALFRPFKSDPGKEERYNKYVKGETIDYTSLNMTDWDREREAEEFAKSSKFFKPLSFEMSNRFTSAGANPEQDRKKELEAEAEKERKEAVRLKMFGQLTRETHQWVPASLLCKRLDVMNPYPE